MSEPETGRKATDEQAELLTLTELEQVRVLADPLRLRIVERLCDEELTTKQVAEALGEKPTKLYHHVEALERVGLIRETRTRRNRGTLERYYLAVAKKFEADARLFARQAADPAATETLQSIVATILDTTARELGELAERCPDPAALAELGVVSFLHLEGDEKTIKRLQRRLERLLRDLQALATKGEDAADDAPKREFRLTLAFYPIDLDRDRPDEESR